MGGGVIVAVILYRVTSFLIISPWMNPGNNCCASNLVIAEEVFIIISWNSDKLFTAKRG